MSTTEEVTRSGDGRDFKVHTSQQFSTLKLNWQALWSRVCYLRALRLHMLITSWLILPQHHQSVQKSVVSQALCQNNSSCLFGCDWFGTFIILTRFITMTRDTDQSTGQLFAEDPCPAPPPPPEKKVFKPHTPKIYWRNVFTLTYFHVSSILGVYLAFTNTKWQTLLFVAFLYTVTKIGITAGVHRLWTHKSYKANFPLRALLMLFFTMAFEGKVWVWARDHRVHHKYQETDADPYNAGRGLWFSHMGWLMQSKHPDVIEKGKGIDMSDLRQDGLVMFQKKYYWPLVYVLCLILPTVIPVYLWGESIITAWHVAVCLRFVMSYNATWLVNSVAHKYGSQPYDVNFFARENKSVSVITLGEGWHNYHHTFPWDYKTSEMGTYGLNLTTAFIDFFAKIGWAYDLKTVSTDMVRKRALRTGDGTHKVKDLWGWDDKDMPKDERNGATVINRKEA